MREIDSNKHAWGQVSQDHYEAFKKKLLNGNHQFNMYIKNEIGDLRGKRVIHLQCNTGADTILLAKMGAREVIGVDLVPDNVFYAKKLANDLNIENINFIESDIMTLMDKHDEKYDMVFVSEGAIGWLPDLSQWGRTIRHLLNNNGFVYVFDSHPFFLTFNTDKLAKNETEIQYPYFSKIPDEEDSIGGYVSAPKRGVKAYFWMYTVSDIINALTNAGLHINYFNEYKENFFNAGGMKNVGNGLFNLEYNIDKFPMSFSIKATVY